MGISAACAVGILRMDRHVLPRLCYRPWLVIWARRGRRRLCRCCFSGMDVRRVHSGGRRLRHADEHGHAGSLAARRTRHCHSPGHSSGGDCLAKRRGTLIRASCWPHVRQCEAS
ncbi:hypothetical protein VTK56DRAFT_8867 [Thermocarpiscus australiensis]